MSNSEIDASYAEQQYLEAERLYAAQRFAEALAVLEPVLHAGFESPAMWNVVAACNLSLNKPDDAERAFRRAIELHPAYCEAHSNLGVLLTNQKRYPEAEASLREALRHDPAHAASYSNLGVVMQARNRLPEAEKAYRQALKLRPDFPDATMNLGVVLRDQGRLAEAEQTFRRILNDQPEGDAAFRVASDDHPVQVSAKVELAHLMLATGHYAHGWRLYENRYDARLGHRNTVPPAIELPQWQGESLKGKSVLVYAEQGNGDAIQFSRYFPVLKQMGAKHVAFVCPDQLHRLMKTARGLDRVISESASPDPRHYDCWTFLLSIPLHARTTPETIPSAEKVLSVPDAAFEHWRRRFSLLPGAKVGLVWKGSSIHPNDKVRSLPGLTTLAPLWSCPSASFVSLQKGQGEDEAARPLAGQPLMHVGSEIEDFADTAAIIAQLDLVITVDTAAAHLAGALGKRCWVLLPAIRTDWRWMNFTSSTPWYPETRLFRQTRFNDWTAPLDAARHALSNLQLA
ncbi:tetratricopeptide repeat protein [Caballeronia sp. BR00000012568055]|uniref:tetratricopeptide repeat protein n=1 Tax=Caballeronia sp. BR00000012568055 TaxID=2918761 RepID=UPI0023F9515F|nr:tetratricopeptide repeat protein [Caballeronia sp. BR00000012568055]